MSIRLSKIFWDIENCTFKSFFEIISWTSANLDSQKWCQCLGAITDMNDRETNPDLKYSFPNCHVDGLSLEEWVDSCDSHSTCTPDDIDALAVFDKCDALVNTLRIDATTDDINVNLICSCVLSIHTVPKCMVGGKPLIVHQ